MQCPKCNQSVADGARFCASCGQPLSPAAAPGATVIRPPRAPETGAGPSAGAYGSRASAGSPGAGAGMGAGSGAGGMGGSAGGAGGAGGMGGGAGGAGLGAGAAAWASAARQPGGLFDRIKNILLTPKTEWPVIESESTTVAQLYKGYVIPLAAFSALMSFLRMSVIGFGFGFGTFRVPLLSGLIYALLNFGAGLLGLFLVGLIIDLLAPTFAGQRNQRQAIKTAAYVFTPAALSSVLGLLGGLGGFLQLLACLYGIYLLYLGLPLLMRSPQDKAVGYTAAVVICTILVGAVFGVVLSMSMRIGGYSPYGGLHMGALTQEERQQQAAAAVGSIIGNALGTDEKGRADLGAAINNLAAAGQRMEQQQQAANAGGSSGAAPDTAASGAAAPANAQSAAAATAGLLTALGGAMGGSHRVDPVDFHTLKALLPESLPGMQRTNAEASSGQALGVKGSSATGDYQGQGGSAHIKIVDAAAVSGLLNVAGALAVNQTSESDSGYEKDATVAGRTVHEKYDNRSKHGELSAIVAKRFSVEVSGDGVDMSTLEQYASLVDFSRLESMKDAGAQAN